MPKVLETLKVLTNMVRVVSIKLNIRIRSNPLGSIKKDLFWMTNLNINTKEKMDTNNSKNLSAEVSESKPNITPENGIKNVNIEINISEPIFSELERRLLLSLNTFFIVNDLPPGNKIFNFDIYLY